METSALGPFSTTRASRTFLKIVPFSFLVYITYRKKRFEPSWIRLRMCRTFAAISNHSKKCLPEKQKSSIFRKKGTFLPAVSPPRTRIYSNTAIVDQNELFFYTFSISIRRSVGRHAIKVGFSHVIVVFIIVIYVAARGKPRSDLLNSGSIELEQNGITSLHECSR